ncbi:MAG: IS30 family transposase [Actinomycetota bacterium]|nr:IS30 family transposase [Actinomycetota bacterium]
MSRSPSTISRELRRNADPVGRYRPSDAHRSVAQRRSRHRVRRVDQDEALRVRVQQLLALRRSPEQVSRALSVEYTDNPARQLVTESIYQALYDPSSGVARDRTCMPLRTRRRRRRPHQRPDARRRGHLVSMTMIDDRPQAVADRVEVGHWEGDYLVGTGNRSAIGTLVERTTRQLVLVHLGHDRSAVALRDPQDRYDRLLLSRAQPLAARQQREHCEYRRRLGWAVQSGWCRQLEVTLENIDRLVGVSFV